MKKAPLATALNERAALERIALACEAIAKHCARAVAALERAADKLDR